HVVLGPHVSVGRGSRIEHAVVENSIIREHAYIHGVHLRSSMTGAYTKVMGPSKPTTPVTALELSLSDYSEILCP
ncbi:MAG: hypothetical protein ACO39U_06320, partial [Bacteroidia bacterium]